MARPTSLGRRAVAAFFVLALAAPFASPAFAQQQGGKKDQPQPDVMSRERNRKQEIKKIYQEWLNKDVAYIITENERAAFKKLATDEEREMFIEQFWRLRDPDPDTDENEYKEEYYERVAHANEKFASG